MSLKLCVVDIETTGLDVDTVDIHCIVLQVPGSEAVSFPPHLLHKGISELDRLIDEGYVLAGHNVIEYDIPILRRHGMKEPKHVLDTLVMSRAAYPGTTLVGKDKAFLKKHPKFAGKLKLGMHRLEDWGYRLGHLKLEYTGGWEKFTQEMLDYCIGDVAVNCELLVFLLTRLPQTASLLECDVAQLCRRMRLHGVAFDLQGAADLAAKLADRRQVLAGELRKAFPSWYVAGKLKSPKRSQVSRKIAPGCEGYRNVAEGCDYQEIVLTEFNPASAEHIADRLMKVRGWNPSQYTETGKPSTKAEVIRDLTYPEAPLLAEYLEIQKILGFLSDGKNAWLKLESAGRLHGRVLPTGTVTSRAAHSNPNLGNVPSRSALGHACRGLFLAGPGRLLVGADASGLQLRGLAHYLARWDDRAFAIQCETGDIHEYMRQGTKLLTRDRQKTWTYAKLFGAGKVKLGQIAIQDRVLARQKGIDCEIPNQRKAGQLGQQTIDNLGDAIPAFKHLEKQLAKAAAKGSMITLDGRSLPVGSEHLAISVLLQGFEACVMKRAMVLAAPRLRAMNAEMVLWVHDEFQVECSEDVAEDVGKALVLSMNEAGESFDLRVRIDGEYKIGKNWGETH